jgi:hypothetical protein
VPPTERSEGKREGTQQLSQQESTGSHRTPRVAYRILENHGGSLESFREAWRTLKSLGYVATVENPGEL